MEGTNHKKNLRVFAKEYLFDLTLWSLFLLVIELENTLLNLKIQIELNHHRSSR